MSESRLAGKVGAFVIVTILLGLALVLVFSKGMTFYTPTYTIKLKTDNVGGLKSHSSVLVSGVTVGDVGAVELAPEGRGVRIALRIHKRFPIHADARFAIEQIGFLGDQFVAIYPTKNEGKLLVEDDEVVCGEPFNFQEVARSAVGFIQRIDQTARVLNDAITRVDRMVLNETTLTNLAQTALNFRAMSERGLSLIAGLNRLVDTNSSSVSITVSNLVRFSSGLDDLAEDLQETIADNRGELAQTMKNLESASESVSRLVKELESGKGVFGSLFKDEGLRMNVTNAVGSFSLASSNLSVLANNLVKYGLLYKPKAARPESARSSYTGRKPTSP